MNPLAYVSRNLKKWVLPFFLVLTPPALGQGFEEGKAAYLAKDYDKALDILVPLANQGNPKAQVTIGMMYDYGQGVPQDSAKAMEWYKKAAAQGLPIVQHDLGVKFFKGIGVAQDHNAAAYWWRKAAENGLVESQYNLGLMYYKGLGPKEDYQEALKWFEMAANQNHGLSQYNLGLMYAFGQGVKTDYEKAYQWFHKAAESGVPQAQYNLGILLEHGRGTPQDPKTARKWYQQAAAQGVREASQKLAALDKGSPAPQPPTLSPKESPSIQRENWINAQNPEHFTIQLVTSAREGGVVDFLSRADPGSSKAYFKRKLNGEIHYTAIYGVFDSSKKAAAALAALPPAFKQSKPLVRQFSVVQGLILTP